MRLLHTSDWHIGRQLHGVSLLQDQAHALEQVVDIARRESVDAVIIAGDVYDRAVPPAEAVRLLDRTLQRLCLELGLPVIAIAGNHDSGERLGFGAKLLDGAGLHMAGTLGDAIDPVTLDIRGEQLDVFALPYAGPLAVRDRLGVEVGSHEDAMAALLQRVEQRRTPGRPTVVAAHCFVDGSQESDSERPLSVGGVDRVPASLFEPFSYSALGHLHRPQQRAHSHIRYSGSLLQYSFSEVDHEKSVTLVDIDSAGEVQVRAIALQPLRRLRIVEGSLEEVLQRGADDPQRQDYVKVLLSDRHAILDLMGRLREVYPNVLQMEKHAATDAGASLRGRELLQKSHLQLFEEFYDEVLDEPMSPAQRDYMVALLDTLSGEGAG